MCPGQIGIETQVQARWLVLDLVQHQVLEAIERLAAGLSTLLQIEQYLTLAFEAAYM